MRMLLGEEDLSIAIVLGVALPYPAQQGAQHGAVKAMWMAKLQLLQHRHGHQPGADSNIDTTSAVHASVIGSARVRPALQCQGSC